MHIYFFDELMEMSINELLDLLSIYIELRTEIWNLMSDFPEMKDFYIENNLYFYLLNIAKIKGTLKNKVEYPEFEEDESQEQEN